MPSDGLCPFLEYPSGTGDVSELRSEASIFAELGEVAAALALRAQAESVGLRWWFPPEPLLWGLFPVLGERQALWGMQAVRGSLLSGLIHGLLGGGPERGTAQKEALCS